jgi:CDP-glycerol glycerophosphotransferase (TagB/SpsB family)
LAKTGLPEGYVVDTPETNPKHWTIFSHVQMTRTVPYVKRRLQGIALHAGPTVDIMPIDYVPDDSSKELVKRGDLIQLLRRTLWIKSGLHKISWYKTLKRKLTLYFPLKIYGAFRSYDSLHKQIEGLMTLTNNDDSQYATVFSSLYATKKETFKRKYFGEPLYVPFENYSFPVPEHYEKILERVYGDYNAMPRIKDRKSKHHFAIDENLLSNVKEPEVLDLVNEIQALADSEASRRAKYKDDKINLNIPNSEDKTLIDPFQYMRENTEPYVPQERVAAPKKPNIFYRAIRKGVRILRKIKRKIFKKTKRFLAKTQKKILRTSINKYVKLPLNENYVFFDSFSGLGILDSPRAIFKNLIARDEFKDYKFVWTVNDAKIAKRNLSEFAKNPNVIFVKRHSKKYAKYLSTAKYLVSNSSVPMYFGKRPEQVYINTWHGVPLKVMGYERIGQRVNSTENIARNFLNATHVIGANHFTAERMFKKAYMLDGIYNGKLVDESLPRTDTTKTFTREQSLAKLASFGIKTDKKIVVYAPTWKGKLYNSVNIDLTDLKEAVRTLKERINSDEYEVFLRVHYFIYRAISMDKELSKICIPFTVDTNELLPAVDILISDYSSIFFDFLSTKKPILFYVPDLADYSENRGLYISLDELPGPVSENLEDIADYINNIEKVKADYADKYNAMFEWCCSKEDGNVCNRLIDDVFFGKPCETVSCKNDKQKILVMADFKTNFTNKSRSIK